MKIIKKYRQKQTLAMRLPSYKPLSIVFRFFAVTLIAIGVLNLIAYVVQPADPTISEKIPFKYYLIMIIAFIVSGEFQIILDNILERLMPVPNKIRLRMVIQVASAFIMLYISAKVVMLFIEEDITNMQQRPGIVMGIIMGLFFVHLVANGLTIARFTGKWMASQKQINEMKQEKLKMDYNSLQDQLNPHFLFNNLSVLKSLIIYDKNAAVTFTENFTDVYRYVLQSKEKRLVNIKEELEFIESYIALHKERLGEGLLVRLSINKKSLDMQIAPLTLQLLVENAIKHNIASADSPLLINVSIVDNCLHVENNVHRRTTSYSTKTGLKNLIKRYSILTDKKVEIETVNEKFIVKVPLLN